MGGKIHSLDIVRKSKNVRTRADFAALITEAWQSSLAGIIKAGNWLETAKEELPHGEWLPMITNDLPFSRYTASMLMKIATNEQLANVEHVQHLPASWGTLYELTKLDEPTFTAAIADGRINPKMERKDVKALRPDAKPRKPSKPRDPPPPIKPRDQRALPPPPPKAIDTGIDLGPVETPIDTCCLAFRSNVLSTLNDLAPEQWDDLFAELHREIDDMEKAAQRRKSGEQR